MLRGDGKLLFPPCPLFFVFYCSLSHPKPLQTPGLHAPCTLLNKLASSLIRNQLNFNTYKGGKFLKKLWCCVGGSITRLFGLSTGLIM